MKIVYCLNSISSLGGIEKAVVVKANALAEIGGNEVHIILTEKDGGNPHVPLSSKVKLTILDINYYEDDWKGRMFVLKGILIKRLLHKKRLKQALAQIKPDIVISVGQCEQHFLPSIKGDFRTLREFHYARDYRKRHAHSLFERISAAGGDFYDRFSLARYDAIAVLTEEDRLANWPGDSRVRVIPNPLTVEVKENGVCTRDRKIVSIGRLERPKNHLSLLRIFRLVADRYSDWSLEIWGEGSMKSSLQDEIERLGLKDRAFLKGVCRDVQGVLSCCGIFALTSLHEGFSLVLTEAQACGAVVVSYLCPCGPKDIITDGKDGVLVAMNDEAAFAESLADLIEHPDKRRILSTNAMQNAKKYKIENISLQWMKLFDELCE